MACCQSCAKTSFVNSIKELLLNLNSKKWMQSVTESPSFKAGSFRAYAKKHGGIGPDGKIKVEWAKGLIGDKSVSAAIRRKANLYLTFMKAH